MQITFRWPAAKIMRVEGISPSIGDDANDKESRQKQSEEQEARKRAVKKPENIGILAVESEPEQPSAFEIAWAKTKRDSAAEKPSKRPDEEDAAAPAVERPRLEQPERPKQPVERILPRLEIDESRPPAEEAAAPESRADTSAEVEAPIKPREVKPVKSAEAIDVPSLAVPAEVEPDETPAAEEASVIEPPRPSRDRPPAEIPREEPPRREEALAPAEPEFAFIDNSEAEPPAEVEPAVGAVPQVSSGVEAAVDPVIPTIPKPERFAHDVPAPERSERTAPLPETSTAPAEAAEGASNNDEAPEIPPAQDIETSPNGSQPEAAEDNLGEEETSHEKPEGQTDTPSHSREFSSHAPESTEADRPLPPEAAAVAEAARGSIAAEEKLNVESAPRGPLAGRRVETMDRTELLALADKIIIEDKSLRQLYETHLVGEKGLRRLIAEYQQGGDLEKALRREVMEHEIDFERDPAMRDLALSGASSAASSIADNAILEKLVQKVTGVMPDSGAHLPSPAITPDHEMTDRQHSQQHIVLDVVFFSFICLLALVVIFLYLKRT